MTLIDFLKYLGCYACGTMRTSPKFRDRAALYLRSMAFGIGRLYFLSRTRGAWLASSLASLGASIGPKGKRRFIMPGLSKELVETTHGLRGRGVTKVGQVVLGYEVARKGGACGAWDEPRGPGLAEQSAQNGLRWHGFKP